MIIGVIGVGRVGKTLVAALRRQGHHVVTTRDLTPVQVAQAATDLLLLSVPDDALAGVVSGLAAFDAIREGQVIAHTSGAHGIAVLEPAVQKGARPLALHPAMTFTGTAADDIRGISYGVTSPDDLREFSEKLVAELGGTVEWVPEQQRALYHAALVHGANHLITLVNEAADRLRDAGVIYPEKVLGPLLRASLENALQMGDNAMTGPVSRGDAGTVAKHVEAIGNTAPGSLSAYKALARRTADRAIAVGRLRPTDAEPLLDVLADPIVEPA